MTSLESHDGQVMKGHHEAARRHVELHVQYLQEHGDHFLTDTVIHFHLSWMNVKVSGSGPNVFSLKYEADFLLVSDHCPLVHCSFIICLISPERK